MENQIVIEENNATISEQFMNVNNKNREMNYSHCKYYTDKIDNIEKMLVTLTQHLSTLSVKSTNVVNIVDKVEVPVEKTVSNKSNEKLLMLKSFKM